MTSARSPRLPKALYPERLGHDQIDSDHLEITTCWSRLVSCQPIQFPFLMARLKRLMRNHFAREQEIMRQHNSTLCACHQQEHENLLGLCDEAARLNESDWRAARSLLKAEFPKRVREHIICMDQLLVLFINTNGDQARATVRSP